MAQRIWSVICTMPEVRGGQAGICISDNIHWLSKSALADFPACCIPTCRGDHRHPSFLQGCKIILCRLMRPHYRVHCRGYHYRRLCSQTDGGGKIICQTMRHFSNKMCCCRHDQQQICFTRQPDMSHLRFIGK